MKYVFLIVIFTLISCKSEEKRTNDFQRKSTETKSINSSLSIDTTSFVDFFESFIFEKEFQKSRIYNPLKINNIEISINSITESLIFYPKKDFTAYLNSDTLSVFEEKNVSDKQDLIIINFKENKNLKYKFENKDSKWMFLGYDDVSLKGLSEKKFIDFLVKFSNDSIYQKQHVLFPLDDYYLDNDYQTMSQKIDEEKWKYFNLVEEIESLLFLANIDSNNNSRNIYYRGVDNGIFVKLTFKRIKNEWFLIKTEDYST